MAELDDDVSDLEQSWLYRFQNPRLLRRYGPLSLYLAETLAGESCCVMLVSADAEPRAGQAALEAWVARHHAAEGQAVARVSPVQWAGSIAYAELESVPLCDLDVLITWVLRGRAPRGEAGAFAFLCQWLHGVSEALEARSVPLTALSLASVLISQRLTPELLLFDAPAQVGSHAEADWFVPRPGAHESSLIAKFLRRCQRFFELPEASLEAVRAYLAADAAEQRLSALGAQFVVWGIAPSEPAFQVFVQATHASLAQQRSAHSEASAGERYRLLERLGEGQTSAVYRAHDRQLEQEVAIKLLTLEDRSEAMERLLREVRLLRSVQHPHVVRGYELYEARGQVGAVMEYIPGETLAQRTARNAKPDTALLLSLADVADGLYSLHRMGIVHRDIKPENVILSELRGAVLVDLGVAKGAARERTLTQAGSVFSLERYRAPELVRGASASAESDVYALACVVLELATPNAPSELAARERLALLGTGALQACLARALADDPQVRGSALQFAEALRSALRDAVDTVRVRSDGAGFWLHDGSWVDLARHGVASRLLRCLALMLAQQAGPATREALIAEGWPGESMVWSAATNRLRVAIAQLRRLGLKDVLLSRDAGYELDPARVSVSPEGP